MADTHLDISVKVAMLHTIANSIYPSTSRKIREAVANSLDNKATYFIIYADRATNTLSLFDNGNGITDERFKEIFKSLGYGLLRKEPQAKLSYFGLGLMSIFRLGEQAKVFTRVIGQEDITCLDVQAAKIFDKKNEEKDIDFLSDCIKLSHRRDEMSLNSSTHPLIDFIIKEFISVPTTFTEIVIENVYLTDFDSLTNLEFTTELRQLLPLSPEENDPFLLKIKDPSKLDKLQSIFKDHNYCQTIDVYYGIREELEIRRLFKYFPDFRKELEFKEADIEVGISSDKQFAYYVVHTTEDLERLEKEGSETGFWVRNQNFLVKGADFFEEPGSRKKYIHEPLKNWMYGEIFHKNMNEFLTVARNDYVWGSDLFERFKINIISLVQDLNQRLRKVWLQKKSVIDAIVKPFEQISEAKGPFLRCNKTLATMGIKSDGADADDILNRLHSRRRPELEDDTKRVDLLLMKSKSHITLADDKDILVKIDPSVEEKESYRDYWDPKLKKPVVLISPSLFYPKDVVFLGKTFNVYFIVDKDSIPGVSVNKDRKTIYVNPFNSDLINFTISFIDILIAVEIADSMSSTKEEMKNYLLKLIGREFPKVSIDYFSALSDDLMRRHRIR